MPTRPTTTPFYRKMGEEFAADEVEIGFPEELVTPYIDHADDLEGLQSEATDY